jgi:hypothetical protein
MFAQRIPHQCGAIPFRPARRLIRRPQQLLIENNLDRFHMLTPLHSILHTRSWRPTAGHDLVTI